MAKPEKSLVKYVIDLLIVAFGVFLGILINERMDQAKMDRNQEKALQYITNELKLNHDQLVDIIAYHEQVKENFLRLEETLSVEDLAGYYHRSEVFSFTKIEGWNGITLPNYETIAFESAKLSGAIQEFDFETTQLISKVYKMIDFNADFGRSVLDKMLEMDSDTKVVDAVGMIKLLTFDVLVTEHQLYQELGKIIQQLEEQE
ncbi:MAG: hypothetical protein AAFQ98_06720 [Bacteroidota bacterium]